MATISSPTQVAGDHYKLFESWYNKLDPKGTGSIQAGTAAQFLKKSNLNDNLLSRIWDLSDPGRKGFLDKAGLFVALKLVALVQNGGEPNLADLNSFSSPPNMGEAPPHPPPPLSKSPGPPLVPAPPVPALPVANAGIWTITPADRARYDQIFNSLGPEANKIHGNQVRSVMVNSKLPTDTLSKIWDLADMDKDGSLDRVEFSIAMHLIYKVLENNQLPPSLPQDMLSSARRAGVAAQGPVPAPLAPPQALLMDNNKLQSSAPPPAPWVVGAADKARYDVMFHNADLDKDGFVSGQEIKGVFLQSGLPQMVLAHIWNLCDMKQTGKLTSEQFALAMWLIQQKLAGVDPPSTLTPEMIPPTMRPKPAVEPPAVARTTYSNSELQVIADEIEELSKDKVTLETEIHQKEATIRLKNNEGKNLQTELDTLSATLKQLENQKGAAQKRLDDLGQQKHSLDQELQELQEQINVEMQEVETLRVQVEGQESSLKAQEEEVMSKQKELNDLRSQEMELEVTVLSIKNKVEKVTQRQQETLLYLSQVKTKMEELQDQEHHMTEVLTSFEGVIASGDASTLLESSLVPIHANFNDEHYMTVGPPPSPDPIQEADALSPVMSPVQNSLEMNDIDASIENTPKVKDTSFVGGHDPFAQAFGGGNQPVGDPFTSWDASQKPPVAPVLPPSVDPFGGDAFTPKPPPATTPAPAVPPAPTTASKKSKQPPPRPAPPKTRPAKPPPPVINSNNNPASTMGYTGVKGASDAFGTSGWGEAHSVAKDSSKSSSGFADFANFAEFDAKYSSTPLPSQSPTRNSTKRCITSATSAVNQFIGGVHPSRSPWGEGGNSFGGGLQQQTPAPLNTHKVDPFGDSFSMPTSRIPQSSWGSRGIETGVGCAASAVDPFGGDYDPFKDCRGLKEADEFSWDEEVDPTFFDGAFSDSGLSSAQGGKDPFTQIDFSPPSKAKISGNESSPFGTPHHPGRGLNFGSSPSQRSKSALGDPSFFSVPQNGVPTRSKTSLGQPGYLDIDFDPLSSVNLDFGEASKSNEDLLNENVPSTPLGRLAAPLTKPNGTPDINAATYDPYLNRAHLENNNSEFFSNAEFRRKGDNWASPELSQGSSIPTNHPNRVLNNQTPIYTREQADIELAMALSRSLVETSRATDSRTNSCL